MDKKTKILNIFLRTWTPRTAGRWNAKLWSQGLIKSRARFGRRKRRTPLSGLWGCACSCGRRAPVAVVRSAQTSRSRHLPATWRKHSRDRAGGGVRALGPVLQRDGESRCAGAGMQGGPAPAGTVNQHGAPEVRRLPNREPGAGVVVRNDGAVVLNCAASGRGSRARVGPHLRFRLWPGPLA
jgi:hypothetical protein